LYLSSKESSTEGSNASGVAEFRLPEHRMTGMSPSHSRDMLCTVCPRRDLSPPNCLVGGGCYSNWLC
ncbi:hypothetical protein AVEN_210977-1, partial [Araneus ventricosus]